MGAAACVYANNNKIVQQNYIFVFVASVAQSRRPECKIRRPLRLYTQIDAVGTSRRL